MVILLLQEHGWILEVTHRIPYSIPFFKGIAPKSDYTYRCISHRFSLLCSIDQIVDRKLDFTFILSSKKNNSCLELSTVSNYTACFIQKNTSYSLFHRRMQVFLTTAKKPTKKTHQKTKTNPPTLKKNPNDLQKNNSRNTRNKTTMASVPHI